MKIFNYSNHPWVSFLSLVVKGVVYSVGFSTGTPMFGTGSFRIKFDIVPLLYIEILSINQKIRFHNSHQS